MISAEFPFLSLLIIVPLVGACFTAWVGAGSLSRARWLATGFAVFELLATISLLGLYDFEEVQNFQWVEKYSWIPSLNIEYLVGIDGLSLPFLPLSALLTLLVIIASWHSVASLPGLYFALLLVLQSMTIGVLSALDLVLFFTFWELTLAPILFLLGLWGIGPQRQLAAIKYVIFMLVGGLALLAAIALLALHGDPEGKQFIFSLPVLLEKPVPDEWQGLLFWLLLAGFAVKTPLLPFHTWLPTVSMEGSIPVVALLIGLKLGAYGIIRFAMPLAPSAAVEYSWALGVLGAVALLYGALIALYQTNFRSLLAYASISHVGLVIIGISSLNLSGIQGALLQLANFTFISGGLMLVAGFMHQRLGSTELTHLGGIAKIAPQLTTCYFVLAFASIGIPGTSGFSAEFMLLFSALAAHPSLGIVVLLTSVLSAAYVLDFSRRVWLGPITQSNILNFSELRKRELGLICVPIALTLLLGFWPQIFLNLNLRSANFWLAHILEQPIPKGDEMAKVHSIN